ncbi:hypothetical protein ACN27F_03530 [Solwaraspora sp. WMMB335]|uniref:hypothetical protein n=1 Tax=Solwaraspora sp. WMMB335 TaxID=3404118 RepID=UPI003B939887
MPLLAVTYVKGRPGATTTALGLAAVAPGWAWPVVLECDPAGGDLTRRHRLAAAPSIVDLAAASRGVASHADVFVVASQRLPVAEVAVPVVVAPAGGAQTRAAVPELTGGEREVLAAPGRVVVADCGRSGPGSPVWPLLQLADVMVVLARANADDLAHLREHLGDLVGAAPGRLVVLLGAGGAYPAAEVADVLATHLGQELARDPKAVSVLGPLPYDRQAAAVLDGDLTAGRRWRRLPLMAAYTRLWTDLTPYLPVVTPQRTDTAQEATS